MVLSETKGLRAQVRMGLNALFGVGCIATVAVVMAVAFDRVNLKARFSVRTPCRGTLTLKGH